MYKFLNTTILYKFLFLMLFVGVLSNKLDALAYLFIVAFIIILPFFKLKANQLNSNILFFSLLGFFLLYSTYIYQLFSYDYNNLYYIRFFGSQLIFFLLFAFFAQLNTFMEKYLSKFFLISLSLLTLVVAIDYILIENGLTSYQLSYTDDIPLSYLSKPLGLFAQFSVNSTYAVVFYMLYLHFQKKQNTTINTVLLLFVSLVIVLQNSGTGYIAYFLLLITMLYRYALTRYFLIPLVILISIFIIQSDLIQKVSSEYLIFLFEYFFNIINVSYLQNIHSVSDVLFGIDGAYNLPIDFGPIFMLGKVGLLYFVFYSIILLYMVYKAPSRYFRMVIFILAFGNLHYPTLFYPIMNVLMPLLFLYLLSLKKFESQKVSMYNKRFNVCVE